MRRSNSSTRLSKSGIVSTLAGNPSASVNERETCRLMFA